MHKPVSPGSKQSPGQPPKQWRQWRALGICLPPGCWFPIAASERRCRSGGQHVLISGTGSGGCVPPVRRSRGPRMVLWPIRSISSRRRAPAATGRVLPRTAQITEMKAGQVREGRGKPRSSLVTESRLPLASPVVPARIGDGLNPLPQHRHAPRHEAGSVHQVAEYQPVPDADDPAWPEQERPVVDRDERPADRGRASPRRLRLRRPAATSRSQGG